MIQEFDTRLEKIKVELAEQGFNSELYYKNKVLFGREIKVFCSLFRAFQDMKNYVNIVPTSAHTGEGIPDLLYLVSHLPQNRMASRLKFSKELKCTVLEVKSLPGLGTTIDVILVDGILREVRK